MAGGGWSGKQAHGNADTAIVRQSLHAAAV
ncbi:protein of unknown function [Paraburkholderia dioscoreae]|uniref:Uncharacterized protein n=1 Tax=Paraburkholderia dioscoreae TaxID=2604047 RepID=A0A5Q4ZW83_9BURK|nr:protein of unknown function [Paraburkholderia dioscoreae]